MVRLSIKDRCMSIYKDHTKGIYKDHFKGIYKDHSTGICKDHYKGPEFMGLGVHDLAIDLTMLN